MIERDGIQQFSKRKLAKKLGIKEASLYTYIERMEALLSHNESYNVAVRCVIARLHREEHGKNIHSTIAKRRLYDIGIIALHFKNGTQNSISILVHIIVVTLDK